MWFDDNHLSFKRHCEKSHWSPAGEIKKKRLITFCCHQQPAHLPCSWKAPRPRSRAPGHDVNHRAWVTIPPAPKPPVGPAIEERYGNTGPGGWKMTLLNCYHAMQNFKYSWILSSVPQDDPITSPQWKWISSVWLKKCGDTVVSVLLNTVVWVSSFN